MFDTPAEFQVDTRWDDTVPNADLLGWDPGNDWCALFSIGSWGVATKLMERDDELDRQRALPLRTVVAHRGCQYLWSIGGNACTVWSIGRPPALELEDEVVKLLNRSYARADLVEVCSFTDDEEPEEHGVEVALRDGSFRRFAWSTSRSPAWALDLARSLAAHLGLPSRHVVPAGSKPATVAEARAADEQTRLMMDGLVDAFHRWDDPDRVAAREAREAEKELRTSVIASRFLVESGQQRLAAWDSNASGHLTTVEACTIGDVKLLRIVSRQRPSGDRGALTDSLRARGDLIGATYRKSLIYWVIDARLCMVWRRRGALCALCRVVDVVEVGPRSIPLAQLRAVVAFRVPDQLGHRGLALELVSGEYVLVEEDGDSRHDPEVLSGRAEGWNVALARELAPALGVSVRNEVRDVITRPPPRQDPSREVVAACGTPVFASTLTTSEREQAVREGRVLSVSSSGWSSMGDSEHHASFALRSGASEDGDLVFARPIPKQIDGSWPSWETVDHVYDAFGVAR